MDSESQRIYDRMTLHHLHITQPLWSTPQLATVVGRSERWVRKWLRRFAATTEPYFSMF